MGAALVGAGGVIPADLSVSIPNLEDALVGLLEQANVTQGPGAAAPELIGVNQ